MIYYSAGGVWQTARGWGSIVFLRVLSGFEKIVFVTKESFVKTFGPRSGGRESELGFDGGILIRGL